MKTLIAILSLTLLSGCVNVEKQIAKLPDNSFDKFTYSRQGNVTSATVTATNAVKSGDTIEVENFHYTANYGVITFDVQIDGLKIKPETP